MSERRKGEIVSLRCKSEECLRAFSGAMFLHRTYYFVCCRIYKKRHCDCVCVCVFHFSFLYLQLIRFSHSFTLSLIHSLSPQVVHYYSYYYFYFMNLFCVVDDAAPTVVGVGGGGGFFCCCHNSLYLFMLFRRASHTHTHTIDKMRPLYFRNLNSFTVTPTVNKIK